MNLDHTLIQHLASLAKLELSPQQSEDYLHDLQTILGYVASLDTLDLQDVEPTTHAFDLTMSLRDDQTQQPLSRQQVLANAPDPLDGAFRVPKVVDS